MGRIYGIIVDSRAIKKYKKESGFYFKKKTEILHKRVF